MIKTQRKIQCGGERVMGYKYMVYASHYPYNGWWEIDKGFETLNEAISYVEQCQSDGYVIIDIQIRDFEVSE